MIYYMKTIGVHDFHSDLRLINISVYLFETIIHDLADNCMHSGSTG